MNTSDFDEVSSILMELDNSLTYLDDTVGRLRGLQVETLMVALETMIGIERENLLFVAYWKTNMRIQELSAAFDIPVRKIHRAVKPFAIKERCCLGDCTNTIEYPIATRNGSIELIDKFSKMRKKSIENITMSSKHFFCPDCWTDIKEQQHQISVEKSRRWDQESKQKQLAQLQEIQALKEMPYAEYLQTKHWQSLRADMLRRAKYKCSLCNQGGQLHVHHRTYENRGNEPYADLIVLCADCHSKFHGKDY